MVGRRGRGSGRGRGLGGRRGRVATGGFGSRRVWGEAMVGLAPGGKVVLAGGAFGSPKILWQSGIGTRDQLEIVRAARGS